MLKKAKAALNESNSQSAGPGAKDLAKTVLDSSRQIWLAGLGAFSRAQQEGTKVFEALVNQGERLEARTRKAAADTAAAAKDAAAAKAKEVQAMAGGTWDKLEGVFEDRVARALSKLGVYTQNDVERLAQRVDALSEAVNALIKATGVKPARKATAGKVEPAAKGMEGAAEGSTMAAQVGEGAAKKAPRKAGKSPSKAAKSAAK